MFMTTIIFDLAAKSCML